MKAKRLCFALDLIDDEELIHQYEEYHKDVWPEVISSLRSSGVEEMQIYRTGNRLFMIMEVNDQFDLSGKINSDSQNPVVQEWEKLMDSFQRRLPWASQGVKWVQMTQVFKLNKREV